MKKLVLETTSPFQGLPELVAYDEGLFKIEGLLVEWAEELGCPPPTIDSRIKRGMTEEEAVTAPLLTYSEAAHRRWSFRRLRRLRRLRLPSVRATC